MIVNKLEEMIPAAVARGKKRVVAACAQDTHTVGAVYGAVKAGFAEAVLLGDAAEIRKSCMSEGIDPGCMEIVDIPDEQECLRRAVGMVREGRGDVLMKGLVSTDRYMRAILDKENGLVEKGGLVSHAAIFELPSYHKLLAVSDVAIIPYPTLAQKTLLVKYLAGVARSLGVKRPRIACIAPSEQLLPSVVSSTEAALLAKMGERGQLGDVEIDGPLSLDIALCKEAAAAKKFCGNGVAGDPDCLLFPNIDAANVFFKAATKLAGAGIAAMVIGTSAPCVLTSRGDSEESKLYSIALACLSAK